MYMDRSMNSEVMNALQFGSLKYKSICTVNCMKNILKTSFKAFAASSPNISETFNMKNDISVFGKEINDMVKS
jgi:hypothetical protein